MPDSPMMRSLLLWGLAIAITLVSALYQRLTGPTYPVSGELIVNSHHIDYSLPRNHDSGVDAQISLRLPDRYRAILEWQRLNSGDRWQRLLFRPEGDSFVTVIPRQPPAGKVRYRVVIETPEGARLPFTHEPVVIRFKGAVPISVLIPHITFMFFSMLFAARTGLQAVLIRKRIFKLAITTTVLLFIGGLILGPIVQKYAFGAYWTGVPFGIDLTDNKTAIAFAFWIVALWRGRHEGKGRAWFIAAAVVHFAVYLIPHSLLGSELDYGAEGSG